MVKTTSRAGFPVCCWISTGIPRPLSTTVMISPSEIFTVISSQYPASASSMALSTISYTRWCSPLSEVEPIYMPGRLRTASSPSSTWISDAPYSCSTWVAPFSKVSDIK